MPKSLNCTVTVIKVLLCFRLEKDLILISLFFVIHSSIALALLTCSATLKHAPLPNLPLPTRYFTSTLSDIMCTLCTLCCIHIMYHHSRKDSLKHNIMSQHNDQAEDPSRAEMRNNCLHPGLNLTPSPALLLLLQSRERAGGESSPALAPTHLLRTLQSYCYCTVLLQPEEATQKKETAVQNMQCILHIAMLQYSIALDPQHKGRPP